MPSHTYPGTDWRSHHFGVSIRLWQLHDDQATRKDFNLVIPETPFAKGFLRSLLQLLNKELDVDPNVLEAISKEEALAHLLIKEEVVKEETADEDQVQQINFNNHQARSQHQQQVELSQLEKEENNNRPKGTLIDDTENQARNRKALIISTLTSKNKAKTKSKKCNTLLCPSCKIRFRSSEALAEHVCVLPQACPICSRRFKTKQDLTTHQRIHSQEKPHKCDQCGKSFRHSQTLKRHQMAHLGQKSYQCSVCGKAFAIRQYLKRHELSHSGEKPYVCAQCGLTFSQAANLNRHRKLVHTKESNFVCDLCGQTFVQRYYLNRHLNNCTKSKHSLV